MSMSGSAREIGLPVAVSFTTRQRLRSAVAGMATLSALSSCVVGPNYEAPRISLTAFHSTAPDNQETSGVRPKLDSWWTEFHDSLPTQTIQEALAQNLDLAASLDRVEQARAAAREAGAQLYRTDSWRRKRTRCISRLRAQSGKLPVRYPAMIATRLCTTSAAVRVGRRTYSVHFATAIGRPIAQWLGNLRRRV
jgi:hypothetical protein